MSKVAKPPREKEKPSTSFIGNLKEILVPKPEVKKRKKNVDLDEVLAYRTFKQVVYLDARLGLLFQALNILIILYIILFAIIHEEGYIQKEQAFGQIELHVLGKTHFKQNGQDLVVDSLDLISPSLEHGALFIATRIENTKQTRGLCGNPEHECTEDSDCQNWPPVYLGKCVDGLCMESGWCPPCESAGEETQVWEFAHPENLTIWIKAAISFPILAPEKTFTTMVDDKPVYESQNPEFGNAYYLSEILEAADVPVVASRSSGAMINVQMEWLCDVVTDEGCSSPTLTARRLDVGRAQGFHFSDALYTRTDEGDPNLEVRYFQRQVGYRLILSSKGIGYRPSVQAVVLQISSGIALLGAARAITDALMTMVLPEKDFYRKYKEENTPDFSDVRDLIKENEEQTEAIRGTGSSRYAVHAVI